MKTPLKLNDAFHHISGYHPLRELTETERSIPYFIVGWQDGFEIYSVAVYGSGLCESDAIEAAEEFCPTRGEADYCESFS